jgi:hypothetical protein
MRNTARHASFEKQLGKKPNLEVGFGPSTSLKAGLLAASLQLVLFSFVLLATDSADFFGSLKQREKKYVKIRYQIHLPAIFLFTKGRECKLSTEKLVSYRT